MILSDLLNRTIIIHKTTSVSRRLNIGLWKWCFTATFNNISAISWSSALLVEETGAPGENHRPAASHEQTLSHNIVSSTPRHERNSNAQL
jgi:hypothetical protein